jgi:predicted MPP superfamily phosphohydrolase
MNMHRTRDGKRIPVSQMTDAHLRNMIKLIERKAKEGIKLVTGDMIDGDPEYEVEEIFGAAVLRLMKHAIYAAELKRRKLEKENN